MSKSDRLRFLPDKLFLRIKYFARMRKPLHLKHPRAFSEKSQWIKLYDHNPLYTTLADKYRARAFIEKTIGKEYLNELYGVYQSFDEIDFDALPDQFVLKCNHDCGSITVCRDKSKLDLAALKRKYDACLSHNYFWEGREWPYKDIKPCIVAEKYLCDDTTHTLRDFKYFCFNGKPELLYVSEGLEDHSTAKISFYDLDGNKMPFRRSDYRPFTESPIPENLPELNAIAKLLANKINAPFIRVDLFYVNGKIYFSEFTFFSCGGMMPLTPAEWDVKLGDMINLPAEKRK